jgi:MoaA/NifB/PqqE/SkfB family radical SAM enzyme
MEGILAAREAGLEVQINTTFTRQNVAQFDGFVRLLAEIKPLLWSVFQLVPTGRAKNADLLTGEELEALFEKLYELSLHVAYSIKTTEGQHYRRVALQRWRRDPSRPKPALRPINDGNGFVFISHIGDIQPSGFLPITGGERSHARTDRRLSPLAALPRVAQCGSAQGQMRAVRISRALRRLARPCLRHDW